MTRLLALFAGNPLVFLAAVLAVFAAGAASGGSAAWWAQGIRITTCQQDHTAYVQDQTTKFQEATHAADIEREQARAAYERASKDLAASIEAGDVYRRCVAAGKCGVRVLKQPTCAAGIRLPAPSRTDEAGGTAIPAPGEPTAESCEELANAAARVQLELNSLQADIENQPGF